MHRKYPSHHPRVCRADPSPIVFFFSCNHLHLSTARPVDLTSFLPLLLLLRHLLLSSRARPHSTTGRANRSGRVAVLVIARILVRQLVILLGCSTCLVPLTLTLVRILRALSVGVGCFLPLHFGGVRVPHAAMILLLLRRPEAPIGRVRTRKRRGGGRGCRGGGGRRGTGHILMLGLWGRLGLRGLLLLLRGLRGLLRLLGLLVALLHGPAGRRARRQGGEDLEADVNHHRPE